MSNESPQPGGVDSTDVFDEDPGRGPLHFDFRTK
jgi:hypothetical protein